MVDFFSLFSIFLSLLILLVLSRANKALVSLRLRLAFSDRARRASAVLGIYFLSMFIKQF